MPGIDIIIITQFKIIETVITIARKLVLPPRTLCLLRERKKEIENNNRI